MSAAPPSAATAITAAAPSTIATAVASSPAASSSSASSASSSSSSSSAEAEPLYDVLALAVKAEPDALEVRIGTHGFVRLRDCMPRLVREGTIGVESAIVEAARVSYGPGTKSVSTDLGLLRYLVRNEHMSPFEMVEFTFVVSCEIFTARQWFRHRTGNFNEESARYSEIEDHFYVPDLNEVRAQSKDNKQGSAAVNPMTANAKAAFREGVEAVASHASSVYRQALSLGVAREQARAVLPVGTYTRFYFKMDARNLMHFLHLRMDSHAQKEIRDYATAIYTILKKVCPHLMALFDTYIRGSIRLSALEIRALREHATPEEMTEVEKREWFVKRGFLLPSSEMPSSASSADQ